MSWLLHVVAYPSVSDFLTAAGLFFGTLEETPEQFLMATVQCICLTIRALCGP